jgi:hypothetical protein
VKLADCERLQFLFVCYRQLVSDACTYTLWIDVRLSVVNNSDAAGIAEIQD